MKTATDLKADLFISLHLSAAHTPNAPADSTKGFEVFVPANNAATLSKSEVLGSALVANLKLLHPTYPGLLKREKKVLVLDGNACPAAMIELGYITEKEDLRFIRDQDNQQAVAEGILKAIGQYAAWKENRTPAVNDTTKPGAGSTKNNDLTYINTRVNKDSLDAEMLVVIDGIEAGKMRDVKHIEGYSITLIKGREAIEKYGEKGRNGVIEVYTKKSTTPARQEDAAQQSDSDQNPTLIFEKVEQPAQFPGGPKAWQAFLQKNINPAIPVNNDAPDGVYKVIVQFVVHRNGTLADFKTLTHFGYGMEEEVLRLMKLSPNWIPAVQNGRVVTAYRSQPVTFVVKKMK